MNWWAWEMWRGLNWSLFISDFLSKHSNILSLLHTYIYEQHIHIFLFTQETITLELIRDASCIPMRTRQHAHSGKVNLDVKVCWRCRSLLWGDVPIWSLNAAVNFNLPFKENRSCIRPAFHAAVFRSGIGFSHSSGDLPAWTMDLWSTLSSK